MNSKKVNWFFLTTILLHILIVVSVVVFRYVFTVGIIGNFAISSAIIVIPALIFLACSGENWKEAIGFKKIKWSTAGMIILFTFLTMPLTTVINAFSMLFVENAVNMISEQVLSIPIVLTFFFMAVSGPFCEEIVFRGVVYRGYRKSGTILQAAVFSALMFACVHMNFNQAAYAFAIGMILALLVEATGSIWASVIYHVIFNGYSVCIMAVTKYFFPEMMQEQIEQAGKAYTDSLLYSMAVYTLISVATLSAAGCVLVWIAKNENRTEKLKAVWKTRHDKKGKMVTLPFLLAVILCIAYMLADVILLQA